MTKGWGQNKIPLVIEDLFYDTGAVYRITLRLPPTRLWLKWSPGLTYP